MDKKNYGFTAPPGSVIAEIDESIEEENLSIEGRNIEMNFGKLEIFQERTKYVTFHRPMTDEHIIYNIKRNRSIKSIKSNFELDHYHGVMKRKQNFKLAVTYKPTIASSEDIEIFDYYSDNENIKIIAKGIALGPRCTLSTRRINFYKTREKQILEHKIEICNDSQASAYFKIDLPNEDVFKVEPLEGVINIGSYCLLTIKFSPNKNGLFARKIICFVWNSEPLVLNVVGVFSIETPDLRLKCFRNDQYLGFKTYFDEFQSFSFNITCLDFGSCFNKQPSKSQIIILANNENCSMFADWNRGVKRRTFNIIPDNQTIEANSVGYFQIHFNLDENFNIFQENVLVQIDWDKTNVNEESSKLPVTAMLRLQGHSFEENNEWISNVVLRPEVVYWQPCLPGQIVYTSFLLQNKSHLPALFKLIPPKKSNVTAKPLMGKFRDTALIAIRLQTEVLKLKTYIEEWKIIINGRENKPLTIHFHGETCIPEIEIGKKNKINAGAVQNNTTKDIDVQMKNLSYYSISFQFQRKNKSIIDVFPKSGILPINGLKQLTIKATGNICAPQKNYLSCQMRVIDSQGSITGDCYDTEIEVDVESSYSQLCACPSYKDFGRMPFGQKVKCQFQAVNFGVTNIFYQTCQSGEEPRDTNFRIKPSFGEVKPKESQTFSILGLLRQTGNQDIHFGYYNRMVKDSPYVTGKPITLFKLSYCTEFPIIQIDEIVEHNFGSLIGKNHLYLHYFEVPKLNKILQTILNDEEIDVVLRMPECEIQEKQYFVILALTNISDFDTEVTIKRKQICHCKMEETSESVFERKTSFKCPHRGVLEVELQDNKFHSKSTKFLKIKIKYSLPTKTEMAYRLEFSNKRIINLFFNIYAIPKDTPRLSMYIRESLWNMNNVYVGIKEAPVQMLWLYNNTNQILNWEINNLVDLENSCKIEGFILFKILNPFDQIMPYSSKALLVTFRPIEIKNYSIEIDLNHYFSGSNEPKLSTRIFLKCNGVGLFEEHAIDIEVVPRVLKFHTTFPVSLSLEYLEIKHLPIWSRRKELIFIKNHSKDKIIQYIWNTIKIDNIIEISVEKNFNILQPQEIQAVTILIKSFSQPCTLTTFLSCETVLYSNNLIHKLTKEKFFIAEKRIDEFMLNEPIWAKRPKNPIIVSPEPDIQYLSVAFNINTLDTKDADENIDVSLQMKQYLSQSIENIEKSILKKIYPFDTAWQYPRKESNYELNMNTKLIFNKILENILSYVVFSNHLKNLLELSSKAPMPVYDEFIMNNKSIIERKIQKTPITNEDIELYRRHEIQNFCNQLKLNDLSNILQTVIHESILQLVQCQNLSYNLRNIDEKIEKSLYVCKNKTCPCNKVDE